MKKFNSTNKTYTFQITVVQECDEFWEDLDNCTIIEGIERVSDVIEESLRKDAICVLEVKFVGLRAAAMDIKYLDF